MDGGYEENAVNVEDYHLDGKHSINGVDNGDPLGDGDTDSNANCIVFYLCIFRASQKSWLQNVLNWSRYHSVI